MVSDSKVFSGSDEDFCILTIIKDQLDKLDELVLGIAFCDNIFHVVEKEHKCPFCLFQHRQQLQLEVGKHVFNCFELSILLILALLDKSENSAGISSHFLNRLENDVRKFINSSTVDIDDASCDHASFLHIIDGVAS